MNFWFVKNSRNARNLTVRIERLTTLDRATEQRSFEKLFWIKSEITTISKVLQVFSSLESQSNHCRVYLTNSFVLWFSNDPHNSSLMNHLITGELIRIYTRSSKNRSFEFSITLSDELQCELKSNRCVANLLLNLSTDQRRSSAKF